jgi:membrane-bound lytic murein transglycosylase MltF
MPVSRDRLIPALLSGLADLVAADLTITDARSELVDFSTPLVRNMDEIVVFAPGKGADAGSLDDLAGTTVYVRKSSSYFEHLIELNNALTSRGLQPMRVDEANELLRTQDILEMVNAGIVSATVVDSYKAGYWSKIFSDMQVRDELVVSAGGDIAWAFRKDSPKLAAVINDFARGHRQGTLIGNVLINRYMENLEWVRNSTSESSVERLRPLLEHFRSSGAESSLDPLMLAAQAYQESELDNDRESPVGALGIMQIKPATAADKNVGIDDISAPADDIRAGARYMRFIIDRYFSDPEIGDEQRWLFALAAYNAGPARIQRLRNQAAAEGHNPIIWLDNVELIAARKIGRETVRYVRNIFK